MALTGLSQPALPSDGLIRRDTGSAEVLGWVI